RKLKKLLEKHKPRYVFAYGTKYWCDYCTLLEMKAEGFVEVRSKKTRAKIQTRGGGPKVALLPFLGNGCFSKSLAEKVVTELGH
ncbi:MAG: hypothetical protein ABIQ79_04245, partial [Nitrospiraceae bacterium]